MNIKKRLLKKKFDDLNDIARQQTMELRGLILLLLMADWFLAKPEVHLALSDEDLAELGSLREHMGRTFDVYIEDRSSAKPAAESVVVPAEAVLEEIGNVE